MLWVVLCIMAQHNAFARLILHPVTFELSTEKETYVEGEKITLFITITNTDKERTLPVLLPHTQNVGQKLFYLSVYDKAQNTMLLRYREDPMLKMTVRDTGSVEVRYLKPLEKIVVPIYLNDFENDSSYYTQTASHHRFDAPLFAGHYKLQLTYNPRGISQGDSIYTYYNDFEKTYPETQKQLMPEQGLIAQMMDLKIKRSADTIVTIERKKYYISTDGYYYYYHSSYTPKIVTDTSCHHITNLPPDSSAVKNEYFYSYYYDRYAEGLMRFDDGDIREYRKYSDWCPSTIHAEKYNASKEITHYATQLPDKRYYSVTYRQPGRVIEKETYCAADGSTCTETTYVYDQRGKFVKTEVQQFQPCIEVMLDGKKRSLNNGGNLEAR